MDEGALGFTGDVEADTEDTPADGPAPDEQAAPAPAEPAAAPQKKAQDDLYAAEEAYHPVSVPPNRNTFAVSFETHTCYHRAQSPHT